MRRSSAGRRTLLPRFTMSILRALQCSPTTVTNRIRRGVDRPLRESLVKTATIPVELPCTDESRARINSVGRQRASGGTPRQLSATEVEVLMSKSDYMGSPGKRRPKRSTSPGIL
jgi:hypothetical protein